MDENGPDILGEDDFRQYKLMLDFAHHVGDILATMADVVQSHSLEELVRWD